MQPPEIAAYAVSGVGALLHLYIVEMSSYSGSVWTLMIHEISGLAMTSNVTFEDEVSGVLGLGFPRLSAIYNTVANGMAHFLESVSEITHFFSATPFFASLSQNGSLDYPVFGLSLTRDTGGSLTLGTL